MAKTASPRRGYRTVLLAIALVGLVRGLFWVVTFPVLDSDEGQHLSYIQTLATGGGIPVTGRDHVTQDTITLFKDDHTNAARSLDVSASVDDQRWGLVRQQYEGFQGPLYYLLMVPFFRLGHLFGLLGAVYAVRLATLLVSLTAVPLLALLAREVYPDRPAVWWLAPACLVALELFNSQFSLVSNDGIMVPLAALCLITLLRARRRMTLGRGAAFGTSVGLCVLGKGSAAALAPALVIAFVALVIPTKPPWRAFLRWAVAAVITASVLVVPWTVFNEHAYGAVSGIKANAALTNSVLQKVPFTRTGVQMLVRVARSTLFTAQSLTSLSSVNRYRALWGAGALASALLGLLGAGIARRWGEFGKLVWLGGSLLCGCAVLILLIYVQAGGSGNVVGRHLGVLLPMFCLLVAGGAVTALDTRLGTVAVLLFLVTGLIFEIPGAQWWVRSTYAAPNVTGGLVPVVDQSFNSGPVTTTGLWVTPPCPVRVIGLIFDPAAPSTVTIAGHPAGPPRPDGNWTTYQVAPALNQPFEVAFAAPVVVRADRSLTNGAAAFVDALAAGSPDVRLYCVKSDPEGWRFLQLYRPEHPFPLTLGRLLAWPVVVAGAATAAVGATLVAMGWSAFGERHDAASAPPAEDQAPAGPPPDPPAEDQAPASVPAAPAAPSEPDGSHK